MSKLKITDAKQLEKLLFKLGFKLGRQRGSHIFYRHSDGRYTTLPHHKGRDLSRPLIRSVLKQIKLEVKEYNELIGKK